ncbi:MAG: chaperone NapD [Sulfuritalea sp.]|nr:chaperone NapD [Sulfuritalea sp.]
MNISSAIIHAQPGHVAVVEAGLATLAGVEVHGISPEGKMIVTIETEDDGSNAATYQLIGQLDGVMSAAMVYHQTESEPDREVSVEASRQATPQNKEI